MPQTFRKLSVVLSLLLAPGAALAEHEVAPFQRTEPPSSLHLLEAPAEPTLAREAPSPAARKLTVAGAALLTSAAAGLGGYALAGGGRCRDSDPEDISPRTCSLMNFATLASGALLGAPLGAWWGGMLTEGRGTFGAAMGGAAVVGTLGLLVSFGAGDGFEKAALLAMPVSTALGALLGYELSHSVRTRQAAVTTASLQPLVSVTPSSAALGLGGSF